MTTDRSPRGRALFTIEAQRLLAEGGYAQAVEICKRGLSSFPENPVGYIILAQAYIRLGEPDRALNVLRDGHRRTGSNRLHKLYHDLAGAGGSAEEASNGIASAGETSFPVADAGVDVAGEMAPAAIAGEPVVPRAPDASDAGERRDDDEEQDIVILDDAVVIEIEVIEPDEVFEEPEEMVLEEIGTVDSADDEAIVSDDASAENELLDSDAGYLEPLDESIDIEIVESEAGDEDLVKEDISVPAGHREDDVVEEIAQEHVEESAGEEAAIEEDVAIADAPVLEEEKVAEESAVAEEAPVVEEEPVVEETLSSEELPGVEEFAIVEEAVVVEETPVAEESAVTEDVPVIPEPPVIERPPFSEYRVPEHRAPQERSSSQREGAAVFRMVTGRTTQEGELNQGQEASERPRPLALHVGKGIARLRSSNLRLIPGLEFAPLRHEDQLRRQSIAPLINEPMPQPELPRPRPKTKAPEGGMLPPLPSLKERIPASGPIVPMTQERWSSVGDEPGPPSLRIDEESAVSGLSPLDELARQLEHARIPAVQEVEQPGPNMFEHSIVSETLANILVAQGAYNEALQAFKTLARMKPERLTHYEEKIRDTEERLRASAEGDENV